MALVTLVRRLAPVALALAGLAPLAAQAAEPPHWTYEGQHGPAHWASLDAKYGTCKLGKHQSPIDIKNAHKAQLPEIQFAWQLAQPKVVNNGHTVQVTWPEGSAISVGDHRYELQQFHFHTPSEEAVAGKRAAMVAHFVHKDADGKLAVVAVLFDVGAENAALAPVFAKLPGKNAELVPERPVDPAAILPEARGYYEFEGSLTTPPCSEGVRWLVLKEKATLSKAQLAAFRKLYPANARPLQPLNGRTINASM